MGDRNGEGDEIIPCDEVWDLVSYPMIEKLLEVDECIRPRRVPMEKLKATKRAWLHKAIHRNMGKTMMRLFPSCEI